jgi:aconitate hydratase
MVSLEAFYKKFSQKVSSHEKTMGRPLTLGEKILFSHLKDDSSIKTLRRGEDFILLYPDRVAMQDATAQMALLQFIQSGRPQVAVPSSIHCDHLITANKGAKADMETATKDNGEVYDFLKSAGARYGIDFWGPGSGIIHQVILENYAFPGGILIGTDSHTPNAGGLGMLAVGVGGADSVDVMASEPWELLYPRLVGVHLKGTLKGFTAPKDIILKLLEILTVKGGTNKIFEYIGEGARALSATGKATIANMGAELGATGSLFAYDASMEAYLKKTGRTVWADWAKTAQTALSLSPEIEKNPKAFYDEVIEIDLDTLEPYIVGPHSPDKARPVSRLKDEIKKESYPETLSAALVGSCTNSSYEDIYKAAEIAKEALAHGVKTQVPLLISPGSSQIFATIKRDGLYDILEQFGCQVLANACGPCIGQWKRDDMKNGTPNAIVTSFNRNFKGRNDSNEATLGFIASPEMVMAYAASGKLSFDPARDSLTGADGKPFRLTPPASRALPQEDFVSQRDGFFPPPPEADRSKVTLAVDPKSPRLALLDRFQPWDGKDFVDHLLLVKVKGKCTTDHISPAGRWLTYRGHLDRISDNMLLGAQNAFFPESGKGTNHLTHTTGETLSAIARSYKAAQKPWMIIGDENYGEGSSREHAAMSPRFLGASCVIVKSFARIHETNLKKQGILALTFADKSDYDKIGETDLLSIKGLGQMEPGKPLSLTLSHGATIKLNHSYNKEQIQWFIKGSSMNCLSPD